LHIVLTPALSGAIVFQSSFSEYIVLPIKL